LPLFAFRRFLLVERRDLRIRPSWRDRSTRRHFFGVRWRDTALDLWRRGCYRKTDPRPSIGRGLPSTKPHTQSGVAPPHSTRAIREPANRKSLEPSKDPSRHRFKTGGESWPRLLRA